MNQIEHGIVTDLIQPIAESNENTGKTYFEMLTKNPFFTGGAGLMGVGILLSSVRRISQFGTIELRRRFVSTLEVDNSDQAFYWLLDFVNKKSVSRTNQLSINTVMNTTESGRRTLSVLFTPGRGIHRFSYKGKWIYVNREREKQTIQRGDSVRTALETVTLTTYAANPNFWKGLVEDATTDALSNVETGLVIYVRHSYNWQKFGAPKEKRPLDSVILDTGIKEKLQADMEGFLSAVKWYKDRGIPYRRGYLFYGPPGTGKSSFISSLAASQGYSICMLSLGDRTLDDLTLNHLLNNAPPDSFILLEDIDNVFARRDFRENKDIKAYEGLERVTMSGLLNAIDGVASPKGRIFFMTTNYVERLDSALIRPGRVDVKQYFGNCTPVMLEQMFERFYENVPESWCEKFRDKILSTGKEYSPASIQGHLLNYKGDPKMAIENVENIDPKLIIDTHLKNISH